MLAHVSAFERELYQEVDDRPVVISNVLLALGTLDSQPPGPDHRPARSATQCQELFVDQASPARPADRLAALAKQILAG